MAQSAFRPLTFLLLVALALSGSAQTPTCLSSIVSAIPSVQDCAGLSASQMTELNTIILGMKPTQPIESYKTRDPTGFKCLTAMMWDIVEYKGKLWGSCLDATKCSWSEMMQWLEMIPKVAAVYGAPNPPAQVLKNGPA
ncbi:hypothetical protein BGW38_007957 [Lunasporangiospora selenospora]|uniref:Uncharacterized protein n=1 Tax=Lunasporangiospora selenospora TaxID=979761 RepID=A0A9P6FYX0_9FUNG|nr:hypothetical protein BGW38_007957 [Lunasporangiospora selenospora]